jgi:hypothetical protein
MGRLHTVLALALLGGGGAISVPPLQQRKPVPKRATIEVKTKEEEDEHKNVQFKQIYTGQYLQDPFGGCFSLEDLKVLQIRP